MEGHASHDPPAGQVAVEGLAPASLLNVSNEGRSQKITCAGLTELHELLMMSQAAVLPSSGWAAGKFWMS